MISPATRALPLILAFGLAAKPCSISEALTTWGKAPGSDTALFPFVRDEKVGFINSVGKVVVEPTLDAPLQNIRDFSEGLAAVRGADSSGFIDESGGWRIRGDYFWVESFSDGLARVMRSSKGSAWLETLYLDHMGTELFSLGTRRGHDFSEGLAAFEAKGKKALRDFSPGKFVYRDFSGLMGYIDKSGKVVIEAKYAEAGPFSGGLARVTLDGYCHRLTPDGGKQGSPTSGYPTSCGGAPDDAVDACRVGFIDKTGAFAIPPIFESARDFVDGLAPVRFEGKWGFIDNKGKWAIEPRFDGAQTFHEGLAAVQIGRRWGYIDKDGTQRIPPKYSWVTRFSEGVAIALDGAPSETSQFIDREGNPTMVGDFRFRTPLVQGLAAVQLDKRTVGYIDRYGAVVFEYEDKRGQ